MQPLALRLPGVSDIFIRSDKSASVTQVKQLDASRFYLACIDPGNDPAAPAWTLNNLLLLAAKLWQLQEVAVICLRGVKGQLNAGRSLLVHVFLPSIPQGRTCTLKWKASLLR